MAKKNQQNISRAQLFRVLNALNPKEADLKAYLSKTTRKTPLELVFFNRKTLDYVWRKTIPAQGELVGIDIGEYVIFAKGFSDPELFHQELCAHDLRKLARLLHPDAKPLDYPQVQAIKDNIDDIKKTIHCLRENGYEFANIPRTVMLIRENDPDSTCKGTTIYDVENGILKDSVTDYSACEFLFYMKAEDLF